MRISPFLVLPAVLVLISSCQRFTPPEFTEFTDIPDYRDVLTKFRRTFPHRLSLDQTAVIRKGFLELTSLGLCSFDAATDDISVALVTTTGIKLLQAERKGGRITAETNIAQLAGSEDNSARTLIEDVENIYFQPVGNPDYCELRGKFLTYGWSRNKNRTELVFGTTADDMEIRLRIKKIYFDNSLRFLVYYSDYRNSGTLAVPYKICYENSKSSYTLELRTIKLYNLPVGGTP